MNKRATEYDLNNEQFEQLIDKYITTVVDSMCLEDFRQYVRNDMWDYLGKVSYNEAINEIYYTLDEQTLDEFVTTIKGE